MNISRRLLQGLIGLLLIISIGGQAMADSPGPGGKFPAVRAARVVKKVHHHRTQQTTQPVSIYRSGQPFSVIVAEGNFDLKIMQGNYRVAVTAPEAYAQAVVIQNNDGVLSLQRDKSIDQFPDEPISVNIWLPYLRELDLFHGAVAAVQGASGSNIRLVLNDQSRISLQGYVPVAEVDVAGDSMVDVSWVDTDHIQIIGRDNSEIHLAGAVRVLDARLYDNAVLDAKYLRSITALVYTCENAMAQVIATYSLNAFATDFSNIYYYRTPEKLVDFSEKSGNVLQVAHWN